MSANGQHIVLRASNSQTYIAANSTLRLPTNCDCREDNGGYNGVFPEFFHGFYSDNYGLDVGILYWGDVRYGKYWKLFCGGDAVVGGWNDCYVLLNKGETVNLVTYKSGSNMICQAIVGGSTRATLTTGLTTAAANEFANGCRVNRELTCASNVSNYIPSSAYFSDATWSNTTLTTTNYNYVALTTSNSWATHYADGGALMDEDRYGYVCDGDINGFVREYGSVDFR